MSILYFYINNVINILFIKAMYESHQVSVFKHFTFIKIITEGSIILTMLLVFLWTFVQLLFLIIKL